MIFLKDMYIITLQPAVHPPIVGSHLILDTSPEVSDTTDPLFISKCIRVCAQERLPAQAQCMVEMCWKCEDGVSGVEKVRDLSILS